MNSIDSFIKEVEERLAKATPGPWFYDVGNCEVEGPKRCHVAHVGNLDGRFSRGDGFDWADDGELIAYSRTDLAKAVKALRVACQGLKYVESGWKGLEGGASGQSISLQIGWRAERALKEIDNILGDEK